MHSQHITFIMLGFDTRTFIKKYEHSKRQYLCISHLYKLIVDRNEWTSITTDYHDDICVNFEISFIFSFIVVNDVASFDFVWYCVPKNSIVYKHIF